MKKLLVFLLMVMYGFSSSGKTLQFHYCCGKLKNVELSPVIKDDCGESMPDMDGRKCCESKFFELKVQSDQKSEELVCKSFKSEEVEPNIFTVVGASPNPGNCIASSGFPPPLLTSQFLFIMNCVFRI